MRYIYLLFAGLLLIGCQQKNYPAGEAPKSQMIPSELIVQKLVIRGEPKTDHLATIRITDKQWSEYDASGNVIGVAEIISFDNHDVKIKWTMAENGAEVGDYTDYEYHILNDKILFTIMFDKVQQGYFEAVKK